MITRLSILLRTCAGSLFFLTSKSAGKSDCGAHDVVVAIRTRLQVTSDVSDKLAVCCRVMMQSRHFLPPGQLPLNVRDVHPWVAEKDVLSRASMPPPANRESEVSLLSLTRVSLP